MQIIQKDEYPANCWHLSSTNDNPSPINNSINGIQNLHGNGNVSNLHIHQIVNVNKNHLNPGECLWRFPYDYYYDYWFGTEMKRENKEWNHFTYEWRIRSEEINYEMY